MCGDWLIATLPHRQLRPSATHATAHVTRSDSAALLRRLLRCPKANRSNQQLAREADQADDEPGAGSRGLCRDARPVSSPWPYACGRARPPFIHRAACVGPKSRARSSKLSKKGHGRARSDSRQAGTQEVDRPGPRRETGHVHRCTVSCT